MNSAGEAIYNGYRRTNQNSLSFVVSYQGNRFKVFDPWGSCSFEIVEIYKNIVLALLLEAISGVLS